MGLDRNDPDVVELVDHYNKWRRIYGYAGKSAPDEVDWEDERLYFRYGYPYPDWWAYIVEATADGNFRCLRASTERRATPIESTEGTFARLQDAGKYTVYEVAETLRIDCRMEPISWKWDDAGLDPEVDAHVQSDQVVKYVLRSNPQAFFIMTRGDMPYSHILPLSYDELDAILLDGFPEDVTSKLAAEAS
ncbi:hypothetical protein BMW24_013145 [Mycobacterium heckeshornense]|uniref:Uncharacterized protein n=1 Tax=Mycobacterium heckeshornense TaxID=110505 RepID=A0A2G8B8E6_9MYCO|nr:hypothetical protein [Mycobacterium heckeshornense]KMV14580.1 hypothetical protein ACT16_23400 [Mycobacterium heckeshornense]MCV7035129.1 hypothetical protein [Mycobacterium heckeshornense]PIJ33926.1 hypothetical protein BMW24_013145 [Mycobacterium heckeshornense]BCO37293.1 hypothetical protein MHEC_37260 [Mycobacterium heckeshornense]